MDLKLNGKRAIVTGASRGIGKVVARLLAEEGCSVVIVGRQQPPLDAAAAELSQRGGGPVHAVVADVGEDGSVSALVGQAVSLMGGVDILVNCAAAWTPGGPGIGGASMAGLAANLNIKLLGYMRMAQAVAPLMVGAGWGRIINIGGASTRSAGSYPATIRNAAITGLTGNLADELGASGVTVNVVHPGPTVTEEREPEAGDGARLNNIGRMPTAEEVAYVVTMLASPLSTAVNGESILASGGLRGAIAY
ncbi:SDR family NAD(P)-dependent oxidoreductase [Phenylobacterium immobile]|uniref:SDR family NAD(P)-dependent oxidoreductase n=1 Tax=Phenylobacterium immobile TaxID=21 RepID=UPI000AB72076|nr:SDR family oxidoreductase [Phenylobacterium immobile]